MKCAAPKIVKLQCFFLVSFFSIRTTYGVL